MSVVVASLGLLLLTAGCNWDSGDLAATANSFKANRQALDAAILEAKQGLRDELIQRKYPLLTAHGFAVRSKPLIVEFSPVSFYYVLVYVEDEANLNHSEAMQDEGTIKRKLGNGWFIIQRGWM